MKLKWRRTAKRLLSNNQTAYTVLQAADVFLLRALRKAHDSDFLFFKNFGRVRGGMFVDIGANRNTVHLTILIRFETSRRRVGWRLRGRRL
ncbi:MAG: hypothetical protein ACUVSU_16950 [Aggregatilineaceae bacterium]